MPTKLKPQSAGHRGRRIERAARLAGLTPRQFVRRFGISIELLDAWQSGACDPTDEDLVGAAEMLDVDARWLATGEKSPAAVESLKQLTRAMEGKKISAHDRKLIRETLSMTVQPGEAPGVCRYCGCTNDFGCGDCEWVDAGVTICSACLRTEDERLN